MASSQQGREKSVPETPAGARLRPIAQQSCKMEFPCGSLQLLKYSLAWEKSSEAAEGLLSFLVIAS